MAMAMRPVPMAQLLLHIARDPAFFTSWNRAFVGAFDDATRNATVYFTGEEPYRSICVWYRDPLGQSYVFPVPELAWNTWVSRFFRGKPMPHFQLARLPPPSWRPQPLVSATNSTPSKNIRPIAGKAVRGRTAAATMANQALDKENKTPTVSATVSDSRQSAALLTNATDTRAGLDTISLASLPKTILSSPRAVAPAAHKTSVSPDGASGLHDDDAAASTDSMSPSTTLDDDEDLINMFMCFPSSPPALKRSLEDAEPARVAKRTKISHVESEALAPLQASSSRLEAAVFESASAGLFSESGTDLPPFDFTIDDIIDRAP